MISRFNSKGSCLINKQIGLALTKRFEGIKHPQYAKSVDIVKIGHNFNPDKNNTEIITFRDKYGKIVQRNIIEKTEGDIVEIKKNYKTLPIGEVEDPSNFMNILEVAGRKISSVIKKNGKYFSKIEEIQTTPNSSSKPLVTISKIESFAGPYPQIEIENQSIYQYSKGLKKGYTVKDIARNNDAGLFTFGDLKCSFENMKDISNDKYFLLHLYPAKNFKRIAPHIVENPQHPVTGANIHWYNKKAPKEAKTVSLGYYNGTVNLNNREINSKEQVIRTTAHEKEHMYQRIEMAKQKNESPEEIQKYIDATKNYIKPSDDFEKYSQNYKEIKANEAGELAVQDYFNSLNNLRSEFPYAPSYQFGY